MGRDLGARGRPRWDCTEGAGSLAEENPSASSSGSELEGKRGECSKICIRNEVYIHVYASLYVSIYIRYVLGMQMIGRLTIN